MVVPTEPETGTPLAVEGIDVRADPEAPADLVAAADFDALCEAEPPTGYGLPLPNGVGLGEGLGLGVGVALGVGVGEGVGFACANWLLVPVLGLTVNVCVLVTV